MQISKLRLAVAGVVTATSFSLAGAGVAYAFQPHMVNAREHLNQALFELNTADPDKGGHRDQAVFHVRQAIDQVNAGIEYADLHP